MLGYVVLGAGILFVMWWHARRAGNPYADGIHDSMEVLAIVVVVLAFILFWPAFLAFEGFATWKDRRKQRQEPVDPLEEAKSRLRATPDNLVGMVTLEEVERRERIHDPLDAVPPLPYGHLHKAWERFRADLLPGDELWSFTSPCDKDTSRFTAVRGYTVRREGVIVAEIMADGG